MPVDLPTVVVEAGAESIARPLSVLDDRARRALDAFSDTTSVKPIGLPESASIVVTVDPQRGARILKIEEALKNARGPLDLGDRDALTAVRLSVSEAYAEARAHPEDPEAPFLVAEALRTLARVEELAGDAIGARALRRRAELIDGGRRIGLSEGLPLEPATAATVAITFKLLDAGTTTVLFVDGEARDPSKPLSIVPGEHHVRVTAGSATVNAQFMTLATATEVTLRGGAPRTPCSASDLAPALASDSFAVLCPRWLRVLHKTTTIEVRICGAASCGAPSTWSTAPITTTPPVAETSVWSSRWTWLGIGAAAVVGGSITAWRLGAFDRPDPPPPTWRWDGAR